MEIDDFFYIAYRLERVEGVTQLSKLKKKIILKIYLSMKKIIPVNPNQLIMLRPAGCGFRYTLVQQNGLVSIKNSYRARKDFLEFSLNNGICRSTIEINRNKIIHIRNGKRILKSVREFFPSNMVSTHYVNDMVVAKKYYCATNASSNNE